MNASEMKEKYNHLYEYMASSGKPEYMKVFGHVMTEMMDWLIANKLDAAEEWLCKLESIKWNNYLTPKEAEKIVNAMNPSAPWSKDVWKKAMDGVGIAIEESPYYNSCALWVTMNMIHSDSAQSIANIMGMPLADVPAEKMVKAVHSLALDKLKDVDKRFNVRSYFGL